MIERESQDGWDAEETARKAKDKKEWEEAVNHLKGRMWTIEVTFVLDSK